MNTVNNPYTTALPESVGCKAKSKRTKYSQGKVTWKIK